MATMKRRIIYLSDEQWADMRTRAKRDSTTISEVVRAALEWADYGERPAHPPVEARTRFDVHDPACTVGGHEGPCFLDPTEQARKDAREAQARRDAILKGLSK